ncbi:hypothetical protein [Amycolatopsis stemonae]
MTARVVRGLDQVRERPQRVRDVGSEPPGGADRRRGAVLDHSSASTVRAVSGRLRPNASATAAELAARLTGHPAATRVHYPGLEGGRPKQMRGGGLMLSFEVVGDPHAVIEPLFLEQDACAPVAASERAETNGTRRPCRR